MYTALDGQEKPEILFTCLADRSGKILVEHAIEVGNFSEALEKVIQTAKTNQRLTVIYDEQYHLHYVAREKYVYAVLADHAYSQPLAFALMREIEEFVNNEYVDETSNEELSVFLSQKTAYFNANQNPEKIVSLKENLEDLKEIMLVNIEKVLNRGEKAELLVNRAKGIKTKAQAFRLQSKTVKHFLYVRKNPKKVLLTLAIVIIVILVFFTLYCEGETWHDCFANLI